MELSKDQIQQIEQFLDEKGFHYADLRLEMLDHMMSAIEHKMQHDFSFESAFVMTKIRWEKHLRKKTSFYFGIYYSNFNIVMQKATKLFRPFFLGYLICYFLPLLILKNTAILVAQPVVELGNQLFFVLGILGIIYFLYTYVRIKQINIKTTYSFVLQTQLLAGFIFLPLSPWLGTVFQQTGEMNPVFSGMAFAGLFIVVMTYHFYNKHIASIKKYQIV